MAQDILKVINVDAFSKEQLRMSDLRTIKTILCAIGFQVNMIKNDGTVIHFNNPKVQASLSANTFAVTGHAENKSKCVLVVWI